MPTRNGSRFPKLHLMDHRMWSPLRPVSTPMLHADGNTPSMLFAVGEPVTIEAAADEKSLPSFKGVAYTGGAMQPSGFYRKVWVDLAGATIASGERPAHRDHDTSKVVGHTTEFKIDGNKIVVAGYLSGTSKDAKEVKDNAANKFPWRLSIGASIEQMSYIDEGEKFDCNGRIWTAPRGGCYVVRACTVYEVSFVSLAGDDNTRVSVTAQQGVLTMNFQQWLAARGKDLNTLTAGELATLRAQFDAEMGKGQPQPEKPEPGKQRRVKAGRDRRPRPTGDDDEDPQTDIKARRAELAAEMERNNKIKSICSKYDNPTIKVGDAEVDLAVHATREGWSADKVELEALRASRPSGPGVHMVDRSVTANVIEASLCITAGMSEKEVGESYDDKTMEAALSKQHRGMGLQQLICSFILAHGGHATPGRFNDDTIRAAFEIQRGLRASGTGSSTYSLPGILSNVQNKAMQRAYAAVPDVLSKIAFYGSVSDFKQRATYQLTSTGDFQLIGPDGELKHSMLTETSFTNRVYTRGQVINLTREHMRNDDLGAFLRIPMMLARKGATSLQKVGIGLLESTAAATFFSTGNKNYIEGSATALAIDSLTQLVTKFEEQVDAAGDPIGVTPTVLLTASQNKVTARQLYDETKIVSGNTGKLPSSNPHAGLYEPHSTPFLTANKDAFYLFADPMDIPAIQVDFLDGRQTPIVEVGDLDFTHLGMAFRGYFDFGCAFGDHRGAAMSKGKA